jgi:hypothetical protein
MFRNNHYYSFVLAILLLLTMLPMPAIRADEGMFMPDKIAGLPWKALQKRGLKLQPTDIYNSSGGSLSEAVVRLSIGCTGEFVSPEGLILTNHHCGYDALVAASTRENNYGEVGYRADSKANELPAQGYSITITQKAEDVTKSVLEGISDSLPVPERAATIRKKVQDMEQEAGKNLPAGTVVRIQAMNDGFFYYKFQYLTIRDIRIVYAPPKSIGFFGGDPDNFEWTRHCGDFTFMRAYVAPDGTPATYSTNNVPYKPKKYLTLSMEGVKDNDFTFVLGYPGSTTRYRESWSVAYNQNVRMPFIVDLFSAQIDGYEEAGRANPSKKVKYQGEIFNLANTVKGFDGGVVALQRAGLVAKKRNEEAAFTSWVNADPARKAKYGEVLPGLERAYNSDIAPNAKSYWFQLLGNGQSGWQLALVAAQIAAEKEKPVNQRNAALIGFGSQIKANLDEILAEREPIVERESLKFFLRRAAEHPANLKIQAVEKRFGNLTGEARTKAEDEFIKAAIEDQKLTNPDSLGGLFNASLAQLREMKDPVVDFALDLLPEMEKNQANVAAFNAAVTRLRPLYLAGISEMKNISLYPDANSTLRFAYGSVKGYVPREAITYGAFTTLTGVMEKDTGREPFNAPPKLRQLWQSKDFGNYAVNGDVPVNFLSTADIIGGNSGSPILNGNGEQIGIVFDGNYEGLGNDFFVSEALGRTISVDIRYVLFVTDKFGGAGWILKELSIKQGKAKTAKSGK